MSKYKVRHPERKCIVCQQEFIADTSSRHLCEICRNRPQYQRRVLWFEKRAHKCKICGKITHTVNGTLCLSCHLKRAHKGHFQCGAKHPYWKGGRVADANGYVSVKLYPKDFFYPMANKRGYVLEHRLIVAQALKRCLLPWEIVHHKEGCAKGDNRYPETLQLLSDKRWHLIETETKTYIKRLEREINKLRAENKAYREAAK